jgi:hypothetical protein
LPDPFQESSGPRRGGAAKTRTRFFDSAVNTKFDRSGYKHELASGITAGRLRTVGRKPYGVEEFDLSLTLQVASPSSEKTYLQMHVVRD